MGEDNSSEIYIQQQMSACQHGWLATESAVDREARLQWMISMIDYYSWLMRGFSSQAIIILDDVRGFSVQSSTLHNVSLLRLFPMMHYLYHLFSHSQ